MAGSVFQIAQVFGLLMVLGMVLTGPAAPAGSSRNTSQECEDQLENNSCLEVKDKGDCDSIGPQLCRKTCGYCHVPIECAAPWVELPHAGCLLFYFYHAEEGSYINWYGARRSCRGQGEAGGDLAVLDTAAKRAAVRAHIRTIGDASRWWVGGHRQDRTISTEAWFPGDKDFSKQPEDDSGDDTCAYLWLPVTDGATLWDNPCTWTGGAAFICQK